MSQSTKTAKDIFLVALDTEPAERAAFLDEACAEDATLRRQVEALLRVHDEPDSLLDGPRIDLGIPREAVAGTIDQSITEEPGTQIGPYKLLQQIGEGGMGVVYMAEQKEPVKRRVALKIIKPGMDTRQVIARFEAERQALAMMDHPNIAKVLDAGATDSGRPYFVMELVNGISATQYCDEQHLTPKERLELFIPICQAVQHAHQKGIIHRDLKPSNVMVALYDDRPVPKVIDFGVAKATSQALTEKTIFTQLGQIVGTLEYMSPEQAQRNQLDIDTRSDIYSLGVLLYELLTGDTPFDRTRLRSAAFDEMLRIIREEEPLKPSTKVSGSEALAAIAANRKIEPAKLSILVRGELDWIVMKALEKDRGRRYSTATSFAEDIQHYLNDEAVVACPPSVRYRFRKFAKRNKITLATGSLVAAVLLIGIASTTWQAIRAARAERTALSERDDVKRQRDRAERAEGEATRRAAETEEANGRATQKLYDALLSESTAVRLARPMGYRGRVWKNLHEALALDLPHKNRDDILGEVLACLGDPLGIETTAALASREFPSLPEPVLPNEFQEIAGDKISAWAISEDLGTFAVSRSGENSILMFSSSGEQIAASTCPLKDVRHLLFSSDGRFLVAGGHGGSVVWTIPDLKVWAVFPGEIVLSMCIHPNGHLFANVSGNLVEMWSLPTNRLVASVEVGQGCSVAFSNDGEQLLVGSHGKVVHAWHINNTPEKRSLLGHRDSINGVIFSPDGKFVATACADRRVRIWSTTTGSLFREFVGDRAVGNVAFSPDGQTLASGDRSAVVRLWDTHSGKLLTEIKTSRSEVSEQQAADPGAVFALEFDRSGRRLAAAGSRGLVVWRLEQQSSGVQATLLGGTAANIRDIAVHPSGNQFAFLDTRGTVHRFDLESPAHPQTLTPPASNVFPSLHFIGDGQQMTFVTKQGNIGFWDWSDERLVKTTAPLQEKVWAMIVDETGDWAVLRRGVGHVTIHDLKHDKEVLRLPAETTGIWALAWSHDRRFIAVGKADGTATIWDLAQVRSALAEFGIQLPDWTRAASAESDT